MSDTSPPNLAALASTTRNPVLALPACRRLLALDPAARALVAEILQDLAVHADSLAEQAWKRRKGPMAAYWRAVCTYAKHLGRAVRRARPDPMTLDSLPSKESAHADL